MEAAARHNRMVQLLHDARKAEDEAFCASALLRTQLRDAQRTLAVPALYGARTWLMWIRPAYARSGASLSAASH